jgi:hypothetical protein
LGPVVQKSGPAPALRREAGEKEFAPAAIKAIKDAGGRFIVRGGDALRSLAMRASASSSPAGNPSMMSRNGKVVNTPS